MAWLGIDNAATSLALLGLGPMALRAVPHVSLVDRRHPVRLSKRRQLAAVWLLLRLLAHRVVARVPRN